MCDIVMPIVVGDMKLKAALKLTTH